MPISPRYFADKLEQSKIEVAILGVIPEEAQYHNIVATLASLLKHFSGQMVEAYTSDDEDDEDDEVETFDAEKLANKFGLKKSVSSGVTTWVGPNPFEIPGSDSDGFRLYVDCRAYDRKLERNYSIADIAEFLKIDVDRIIPKG